MTRSRNTRRATTSAAALSLLVSGLAGCSSNSDAGTSADDTAQVADFDCDTLAEEAVRISSEQAPAVELLKVRKVKVVEDERETYSLPTGDESVLVLSCKGTGVWSDGDEDTKVLLSLKVDSDGSAFVYYEPMA